MTWLVWFLLQAAVLHLTVAVIGWEAKITTTSGGGGGLDALLV